MSMNPNERLEKVAGQVSDIREWAEQTRIERIREQEKLAGIKEGLRLPVINAKGANPFTAGGDTTANTPIQKPDEGRAWYLRHLVIQGMTRGSTPDIIQVLRGSTVIWELNGNQYAQTWGKTDIKIMPGESLAYQSVGTFAATGNITITGSVDDYPAEKIGMAGR